MHLSRRNFLVTSGAALAAPGALWAAGSARRDFIITLGRRQIGASTIALRRQGAQITADISAHLDISILGLLSFSYDLRAREMWANGRLQSLEAQTDNDGSLETVRATATSDGVQVHGTAFSGLVRGNPATTSFFAADFLTRPQWISTQDGNPLSIRAGNSGTIAVETPGGSVNANRYIVSGDMDIELYYTAQGEWIGSQRSIAGQRVKFLATDVSASLMSVWLG